MGKYQITAPDGGTYEITAPEGASEADVMAYAQANYKKPATASNPFANVQSGSSTVAQKGDAIDATNAANRAYMASPQRAADKASAGAWQAQERKKRFAELPMPARFAIGAGGRAASMARGVGQLGAGLADYAAPRDGQSRYDEAMAGEAAARGRDKFMEGDAAATVGGIVTDVATMAVPLSKMGNLSRAGQYGASITGGAALGAAQPVIGGESRGANTAIGGGLGLVGQGVSDVAMAAGKRAATAVTPELRKLYEAAKARGIQLTPAQLSDSGFVKRLALMVDSLPFSGATGRNQRQGEAVGRQVAQQIGQKADVVDQSVMGKAYGEMGDEYDALYAQGMRYDREFLKDVAGIRRGADGGQMDDTALGLANSVAGRIKKAGNGGDLKGRTLQSIDQQARRGETGGGDRQLVASELRDAIRRNMERNAADPAAIRDLNRRYATYKQLEPLVARSPEGITPSQLMQGVNANGKGKARMARGEAGEMGELAKIAKRMQPAKSSGTMENKLASDWRNPLTWPLRGAESILGAIGGRTLNSGALADFLMRQGRGQGTQLVAPYLRPAALPASGTLSEMWQQRTNDPRKRP